VITVRGVRAGEGSRLRELRMRALADAPEAFGATPDEEVSQPDEHWERLADGGDEFGVYVALDGDDWIGMAAGRWFARDRGVVQLWGMWVVPSRRGEGLGVRLVDAVRGWSRQNSGRFLRLGVIDGSAAIALYERLGFVDTGERKPLRRDASLTAVYMARPA
jgi:ribosomal protein S18 acetylase RimI-like enzyme